MAEAHRSARTPTCGTRYDISLNLVACTQALRGLIVPPADEAMLCLKCDLGDAGEYHPAGMSRGLAIETSGRAGSLAIAEDGACWPKSSFLTD